MQQSRRAFLASGVAVAASVAGCSSVVDRSLRRTVEHEHVSDQGTVDAEFSEDTRASAQDVGTTVQRSVVKVEGPSGRRGGTGWVYGDGLVVTNAHVVQGETTYSVTTFEDETVEAERLGYVSDMRPDVGLLAADVSAPALPRGSVADLERGDPLVTVGHPSRIGEWLITLGRFERYESSIDWVLSTVPVASGNSGGPLVSLAGEVVGMVSGSSTMGEHDRISKSDTVYTELPSLAEYTTGNPIESVESKVATWTA